MLRSGLGDALEWFDKPDQSHVCPFDQLHLAFLLIGPLPFPVKDCATVCIDVCVETFLQQNMSRCTFADIVLLL